ncbi:hypothetical protein FRZ03_04740 [Streptomyces misionensis]|uniref:Uncharacterized protein n=1 Tax=Streptomyces misionensis TaxID=67331 RepID=A0A5C6JZX5_9ACTN|nr:hypothetical protein FRZ03_04740 [Streptomyces misionensis]
MTGKLKKLVFVALTTAAITAIIPAGTASAINTVDCPRQGSTEFVRLDALDPAGSGSFTACFANAGEMPVTTISAPYAWARYIWTGNNRVQWYGDGRWQPDTPIDKWTTFSWPHYPGGVKIEAIRIL